MFYCIGCGMRFRTAIAEAKHRHNFPLLCRPMNGENKMTQTPTDKVRAALDAVIDNAVVCESSYSFTCDGAALGMLKNARRELEGMVILPIEMTESMNEAIRSRFGCYDCTATEVDADNAWSDLIAPYVKGE